MKLFRLKKIFQSRLIPLWIMEDMLWRKNVTFTDNTPSVKATRPRVKLNTTITSSDNKIVININEDANRIENCILEFEVDRVMDLNENRLASPFKMDSICRSESSENGKPKTVKS